jgi:hypothetical protein
MIHTRALLFLFQLSALRLESIGLPAIKYSRLALTTDKNQSNTLKGRAYQSK